MNIYVYTPSAASSSVPRPQYHPRPANKLPYNHPILTKPKPHPLHRSKGQKIEIEMGSGKGAVLGLPGSIWEGEAVMGCCYGTG
jgi:hypothetical protein